jgi:predicted TIM-barrel fold metal-dependent hydrolase
MYPPRGWRPDDEAVRDAFLAVQEMDVPVFLHMGRTAPHPQLRSHFARPLHLEGLGLACPRLKVIIGHFGAPWSMEACHIAMGFENFFFDLSTSGSWCEDAIMFAARSPHLGAGRLLLGTNGDGASNLADARETIGRLAACGLSPQEQDCLACTNACNLLGLKVPA